MLQYNPSITGSLIVTGSINASQGITGSLSGTVDGINVTSFSSSIVSTVTSVSSSLLTVNGSTGSYATTGSNTFTGAQTVQGTLTAQTLVVQTVTSSVDYVTGSTRFGSSLSNTHLFTGSVALTGSLTADGALSGTSATFSSQVTNTSGMLLNVGATGTNTNLNYTTFTNGVYSALNSSTPSEGVGMWSDNQGNGMIGSLYNNNASSLNLVVRASSSTGGLVALKLSGLGGAATFTGSVTALNYFNTAATTAYAYSYYSNTGGAMYLGIERSTGQGLFTNSSAYATVLGSSNSTNLQFGTNGAVRVTIDTSGNIGIGTTSPSYTLDARATSAVIQVKGTGSTGSTYSALLLGSPAVTWNILNDDAGPGGDLRFYNDVLSADAIRIKKSNNYVGIGTTSPSSLLQVNGQTRQVYSKAFVSNPLDTDGYSGHIIVNTNNSNGSLAGIGMYTNSSYTAAAGVFALQDSSTAASLVFYAGSNTAAERMRITYEGNIQLNSTGMLYSTSTIISIPNSATTIFTSTGYGGVWLVTYAVSGNPAQIGYAIVGNVFGSTLSVIASAAGSQTALSTSGLNLQLSQSAGGSINTRVNVIRLNTTYA